jgi:hypothetical protein
MPAALVMQGLMDVGRMGSSSIAAHLADIHQSKDTLFPSEPLLMHFTQEYPISIEPFLC